MAATNKRARELARAKEERRRARQAAAAARRKRRIRFTAIGAVLAVLLVSVGAYLVSSRNSADAPSADGPQPVASCQPPGEQQATQKTFDAPGDGGLGGAATATFTLQTNCADIVIAADAGTAPKTVDAMAFLANEQYFDATLCDRLTTDTIFVLQCGDPTGSGPGSPGFTLPDENLPKDTANNYPAGTVAMANSGPGTSGSQFFIVYKDTMLPATYTIWGTVTAGLDIVEQVAQAGTADGGTDGAPLQSVMIQRATAAAQ